MNKESWFYSIFLVSIVMVGIGLAAYATIPFGAGVAGDSARYMSNAQNLLNGNGFLDYAGTPLVYWPPLYPLVLAAIGLLAGGDVFLGGWLLNIFLYGLNLFLSGLLFGSIFPQKSLFRYAGCIFLLASVSSLRLNVNIASDPLFIATSLFFLLSSIQYLHTSSKGAFRGMIFWSILACLLRFLGVSLVVTGALLIIYKNWNNWRKAGFDVFIFGSLSILPLTLWVIVHNIIGYGTFWGDLSSTALPWENLRLSLVKIILWFIPLRFIPGLVINNPLVFFAGVVLVLILVNKKENWREWERAVLSPSVFPILIFLTVSLVGLMYFTASYDHESLKDDRYYVGLQLPVLVLLFISIQYLVISNVKTKPVYVSALFIFMFMVWNLYPIHELQEFLKATRQDSSVAAYNIHNTREIRNSKVMTFTNELLANKGNIHLYSNDPGSVWFMTRHNVKQLPWLNEDVPFTEEIAGSLAGWPDEPDAYVIWVYPDYFETTVTPDELSQVTELELLFRGPDGSAYYVPNSE